ncbi:MAG: hypothetical protein R2862_07285 [Thermoanaerobaculia bacterium]
MTRRSTRRGAAAEFRRLRPGLVLVLCGLGLLAGAPGRAAGPAALVPTGDAIFEDGFETGNISAWFRSAQPGVCYGSGGGTQGGDLMTFDTTTGVATIVANCHLGAVPGLAIDSRGKLFAASLFYLAVVDPVDGSSGVIGSISGVSGLRAIAFDDADVLYATDGEALYTVDTATAATTLVGSHVTSTHLRGLAFDPGTGTLYGSSVQEADKIYTIDKATGQATLLGTIGIGVTSSTPDLCFLGGLLYGVKSGNASGNDDLVSISPTTGVGIAVVGGSGATGVNGVSGMTSWIPE